MTWFVAIILAALAATIAVSGLTYLLFWYEIFNDPEQAPRPGRGLAGNIVPMLSGFCTGVFSQLSSLVLYPAFLFTRLWAPRPEPDPSSEINKAPALLMVHGLFHTASAWVVMSRRLAGLGLSRQHYWNYPSCCRSFANVLDGLDRRIEEIRKAEPDRPLALVGHSLGGLLIRAWLKANPDAPGILCAVTLGAPHQGSRLACLGVTALARSLRYKGDMIKDMEQNEGPAPVPCLSIRTPVDNMVLPPEGTRVHAPGWTELATAPVSHIFLLYHRATARDAAEFIRESAAQPDDQPNDQPDDART